MYSLSILLFDPKSTNSAGHFSRENKLSDLKLETNLLIREFRGMEKRGFSITVSHGFHTIAYSTVNTSLAFYTGKVPFLQVLKYLISLFDFFFGDKLYELHLSWRVLLNKVDLFFPSIKY